MPRVKRGPHRRASRKKVLELASGYFLTKSKLYRAAQEAVERGLKFAYVGRKLKKREYRSLWIVRINASCRAAGVSYSQFIRGLKAAGFDLNRKVLADIALHDEAGFTSLIQAAKAALEDKATPEPAADAEPAPRPNLRLPLSLRPRRKPRPPRKPKPSPNPQYEPYGTRYRHVEQFGRAHPARHRAGVAFAEGEGSRSRRGRRGQSRNRAPFRRSQIVAGRA